MKLFFLWHFCFWGAESFLQLDLISRLFCHCMTVLLRSCNLSFPFSHPVELDAGSCPLPHCKRVLHCALGRAPYCSSCAELLEAALGGKLVSIFKNTIDIPDIEYVLKSNTWAAKFCLCLCLYGPLLLLEVSIYFQFLKGAYKHEGEWLYVIW